MTYTSVTTSRHGTTLLIVMDRAKALNAINRVLKDQLIQAFRAFDVDPDLYCAVLTGSGRAFAAGADIAEMSVMSFGEMYRSNFAAEWEEVTAIRKPWIAAVNGYALGGGCELTMMADFVIAADDAQFGQPEIGLGISPGWGGTQRLTRAIGKSKAMEMCLTGRMMDAAEAERAGLVARVVPADKLLTIALDTAEEIGRMPTLTLLAVKQLVNAAFESGLKQGLCFERSVGAALDQAGNQDKSVHDRNKTLR